MAEFLGKWAWFRGFQKHFFFPSLKEREDLPDCAAFFAEAPLSSRLQRAQGWVDPILLSPGALGWGPLTACLWVLGCRLEANSVVSQLSSLVGGIMWSSAFKEQVLPHFGGGGFLPFGRGRWSLPNSRSLFRGRLVRSVPITMFLQKLTWRFQSRWAFLWADRLNLWILVHFFPPYSPLCSSLGLIIWGVSLKVGMFLQLRDGGLSSLFCFVVLNSVPVGSILFLEGAWTLRTPTLILVTVFADIPSPSVVFLQPHPHYWISDARDLALLSLKVTVHCWHRVKVLFPLDKVESLGFLVWLLIALSRGTWPSWSLCFLGGVEDVPCQPHIISLFFHPLCQIYWAYEQQTLKRD